MKKIYPLLLAALFLFVACDNKSESKTDGNATDSAQLADPDKEQVKLEEIAIPADWTVLAKAEGDLDKDGTAEEVVVYNIAGEPGDEGNEREVQVHKKRDGQWKLWYKTRGPVLGSQDGGMMGDPFESISIERNCIVINHFGGSADKWHYTHRFRYQNGNWELIGATVNTIYFYESEDLDYNLSTGDVVYEAGNEDPEKKIDPVVKKFNLKPASAIKMDGFVPGDREVKIPDVAGAMYY